MGLVSRDVGLTTPAHNHARCSPHTHVCSHTRTRTRTHTHTKHTRLSSNPVTNSQFLRMPFPHDLGRAESDVAALAGVLPHGWEVRLDVVPFKTYEVATHVDMETRVVTVSVWSARYPDSYDRAISTLRDYVRETIASQTSEARLWNPCPTNRGISRQRPACLECFDCRPAPAFPVSCSTCRPDEAVSVTLTAGTNLSVVSGMWKRRCANCGKIPSGRSGSHPKCSRCRAVYYCGTDCQTRHWRSTHKRDCVPYTN